MNTLFNAVDISLMGERKKLENHLELLINSPKNYESQVDDIIAVLKKITLIDQTMQLWDRYSSPQVKQAIKEDENEKPINS